MTSILELNDIVELGNGNYGDLKYNGMPNNSTFAMSLSAYNKENNTYYPFKIKEFTLKGYTIKINHVNATSISITYPTEVD